MQNVIITSNKQETEADLPPSLMQEAQGDGNRPLVPRIDFGLATETSMD